MTTLNCRPEEVEELRIMQELQELEGGLRSEVERRSRWSSETEVTDARMHSQHNIYLAREADV